MDVNVPHAFLSVFLLVILVRLAWDLLLWVVRRLGRAWRDEG